MGARCEAWRPIQALRMARDARVLTAGSGRASQQKRLLMADEVQTRSIRRCRLDVRFARERTRLGAGTVRPLAISRIQRSSLYPDLPTMDEAGVTGFNLDAWAG